MKIAMIGHKIVPSRLGGVEIVVEETSTRLVKYGHRVDIYNRRNKNSKIKQYKGTKIITIPTINKTGLEALIYSFFATVKAVCCRYDIIHFHAEGPCAMIFLPHIFKIKTVATIHGLDWQRSKWGDFASKYIKFGEKMAAKYADEIIVLSKNVQEYFKKTYNRETKFIPNGVNVTEIKNANIIKKKYNLKKDKYILFLARIVPEKGLQYLIDAFKLIDTDIKLVIAGASSDTNKFHNEIKKKVEKDNRIIMTGFVEGKILEELYSNCLIYCLPSDVEGMPISLLEAMSYGCTCLVSDIEENLEIVREYGYSFKKGDVIELCKKLQFLINAPQNNREKEIKEYIKKNYNWDKTTKDIEKLYKSAINHKKQ